MPWYLPVRWQQYLQQSCCGVRLLGKFTWRETVFPVRWSSLIPGVFVGIFCSFAIQFYPSTYHHLFNLSLSNNSSWIICVEFRSLIYGLNPPLSSKTAAMCRHHLQLWFSLQGRVLVAPTDTCSNWQLTSIAHNCTSCEDSWTRTLSQFPKHLNREEHSVQLQNLWQDRKKLLVWNRDATSTKQQNTYANIPRCTDIHRVNSRRDPCDSSDSRHPLLPCVMHSTRSRAEFRPDRSDS